MGDIRLNNTFAKLVKLRVIVLQDVDPVFDTSRALETRVADPAAYFHLLRKKLGKLKLAAAEFRKDAPLASTHTNFQQAVISMDTCVRELESVLQACANISAPAKVQETDE